MPAAITLAGAEVRAVRFKAGLIAVRFVAVVVDELVDHKSGTGYAT
jgi:hypothetical protein